jgi:hypothetical protein
MDTTGVILLTGIGLVVGFLLAALIFSLRGESTSQREPQQQLLTDSEKSIHVWREGGDQHLVVEMGGVSHHREDELPADQKQALTGLVRELQAWLGTGPTPAAGGAPPAGEQAVELAQGDETRKSTSLNPLKVFGDALQPASKPELDEQDQSIVNQIDQILQKKLEGTQFEEKGVRLVEGPDQGMEIKIGLDKYTEIESVPDERIRQLIRISVAEWERTLGD